MSDNEYQLFPVDTNIKNPHDALCQATMGFFDFFGTVERLKYAYDSVFDRDGHGFDNTGGIASTYESSWMTQEGIEHFAARERYVVGWERRDGILKQERIQWVMYSKPEIQGWFALLTSSIVEKKSPQWKQPLDEYLGKRFNVSERLALLYSKLSGEIEWDYGPVGNSATEELIVEWKNQHCKELADEFFNQKFSKPKIQHTNSSEVNQLFSGPYSDNWQQYSTEIDELNIDIFFDIHHYLYIGDSDPKDSFRHNDFERHVQENIISRPTGRISSKAALQAIEDLSTHFNRANEINESPSLKSPGIQSYFGLNLWLINSEENLYLHIPACYYLSDLHTLFTWFDQGPMNEELYIYEDQYLVRFIRLENRLHIHYYDATYEEEVANISTSFNEAANAVSLAKSRVQSVISEISENLGIDKWTKRPPPDYRNPPESLASNTDTKIESIEKTADAEINNSPPTLFEKYKRSWGLRLLVIVGISLMVMECQSHSEKDSELPPPIQDLISDKIDNN